MTRTEAQHVQLVAAHLRGEVLDPTDLANALAYLDARSRATLESGPVDGPTAWHDRLIGRGWYTL